MDRFEKDFNLSLKENIVSNELAYNKNPCVKWKPVDLGICALRFSPSTILAILTKEHHDDNKRSDQSGFRL